MRGRPRKSMYAPLTSEEQYQKTRQQINKTNKSRANNMEKRIAKYLRGSRVPMSGAASQWKGDCIIPLIHNPGIYLVECKLTAARLQNVIGNMAVQLKWFSKLVNDVKAMNAKFGILVIHYVNFKDDYVFISVEHLQRIIHYGIDKKCEEDLQWLMSYDTPIIPKITGLKNKLFNITNQFIRDMLITRQIIHGFRIQLDQTYIVLPLEDFRTVVWNL